MKYEQLRSLRSAIRRSWVFALLIFTTSQSHAEFGWSVSSSTLGVGAEASWTFKDTPFAVRGGWNGMVVHYDSDVEDTNGQEGDELSYSGTFTLNNARIFGDWHPWGSRFRVTTGIVFNQSEIDNTARCRSQSGFCETGEGNAPDGGTAVGGEIIPIGATQNGGYSREFLGRLKTAIDFNPVSPYLGFGWSHNNELGWSLSADFGVAFIDGVEVTFTSTGPCNESAACRASLEDEAQELEDDFEELQLFPVASIGFTWRF